MKSKLERFKQGIKDITPLQQLQIQLVGTIGTIVGVIFAWITLILLGMGYWSIVLFFTVVLQVSSLIGIWQKYTNLKEMLDMSSPIPQCAETQGSDAVKEVVEGVQQSQDKVIGSADYPEKLDKLWR